MLQQPSPLDEAQLATLASTRAAKRKLRIAGYIALSNVFGLGLCGILSLGFGLLSLSVSLIGLVLLALAWNEERGRTSLLRAEPGAPRHLAMNQVLLLLAVLVYCAYSAYMAWTGPSPLDAVLQGFPELPDTLDGVTGSGTSVDELSAWGRVVALLVYGAIAVGSLVVQGLTAVYYRSLAPAVAKLAAAPAWARELS